MLADGELLAGRYLLNHPLAAGGMSDVWKATDQVLDRPVAIKVIRPGLLAEPGFAQRFAAEARILAGLRHPGIVGVHDYGEAPGPMAYLVMEFVDGEPLSGRLAREHQLTAAVTMDIVAQAADALQTAHLAGVVHRDIKPANLLICPDGKVVVVDFGVAKAQLSAGLTQTDTVLGTARYMSPEQVAGRSVGPTTDVYALGAVAYECLAGRPPFDAETPVAIAYKQVHEEAAPLPDAISAATRAVVTRAMAKDPADRFPDAAALAAAARAASQDEPGVAGVAHLPVAAAGTTAVLPAGALADTRPAGVPAGTQPLRRRRPTARYAMAGAGVAGALAAVLFAASLAGEDAPGGPAPSTSPGVVVPSGKASSGGSGGAGSVVPGASQPAGATASATPGSEDSPGPAASPSVVPPPVSDSPEPDASPETTEPAATQAAAEPSPSP